jgi:hypothetical protein
MRGKDFAKTVFLDELLKKRRLLNCLLLVLKERVSVGL